MTWTAGQFGRQPLSRQWVAGGLSVCLLAGLVVVRDGFLPLLQAAAAAIPDPAGNRKRSGGGVSAHAAVSEAIDSILEDLRVRPSIRPSVYLPTCLSFCPSVRPSIGLQEGQRPSAGGVLAAVHAAHSRSHLNPRDSLDR
jgi:hypothetical protein